MRMFTKAAIFAVALAFPMASFAQGTTTPKTDKKASASASKKSEKASAAVANKTTSGTVKSVSDSSLVITRGTGKNAKDETFTVNASTKKTGDVKEGGKVTVAYTSEGGTNTATSIKAAAPKAAKAGKTSKKK